MDTNRLVIAFPLLLIRVYQALSRGFPRRCRFYPSCSDYMRQALETRGLWKGLRDGTARLFKCHPWHPGGYDPIQPTPSSPAVVSGGSIGFFNYDDGSRLTTCRDDEP